MVDPAAGWAAGAAPNKLPPAAGAVGVDVAGVEAPPKENAGLGAEAPVLFDPNKPPPVAPLAGAAPPPNKLPPAGAVPDEGWLAPNRLPPVAG